MLTFYCMHAPVAAAVVVVVVVSVLVVDGVGIPGMHPSRRPVIRRGRAALALSAEYERWMEGVGRRPWSYPVIPDV